LIQNLSYISDGRDVIALELKTKAQDCGQILYSDLDELAISLQDGRSQMIASSVAAKFSAASSTQAKLLRVLKTIDYMYSPKPTATASAVATPASKEDVEKVQAIYESFRFTPLWRRLGDCLSSIGEIPQTEHIATVLLPLIESFMVVCKFVGSKPIPRALRGAASPQSPTTPKESMEDLFISFTDVHRKIQPGATIRRHLLVSYLYLHKVNDK
jgi:E3 ubiquitin-protein ligase HUWE1